MNLYDELYNRNKNNLDRVAACQMMKTGELRSITYKEMLDSIDRYCEVLSEAGYKPGDRIGICGAACPEWNIAFYAVHKMKCTVACLDHTYGHEEMLKMVAKSRLKGLYLTESTKAVLDDPVEGVNIYRLENGELEKKAEYDKETEMPNPEAAVMIFSSGTTSTAAGIVHRADSLVDPVIDILEKNKVDSQQRFLGFLPNSHVYGCAAQCNAAMLYGSSICYMEELTATCILGAFEAFKPTIILGVPKVYELLQTTIMSKIHSKGITTTLFNLLFPICLNLRKKTGINLGGIIFSSVRKGIGGSADVLLSGGAPLRADTAELFYGTGMRPLITYGATETSVPTLGNFGKNITMHSCGRPYADVEVKVSDEGEMLIKSPYLMIGYFDEPERTAEAYTEDGWFKSGDLVEIDENQNIIIKGRLKENIVLATGKKVAPDDIEKNYAGIAGVEDYTVAGIPVKDAGYDEVYSFIVPAAGADTAEVEAAFMKRSAESPLNMKLAGVKFLNEIPRTSIGKPKRYQLSKLTANNMPVFTKKTDSAEGGTTLEDKIIAIVKKIAKTDNVNMESRLYDDLALDSLSIVELCTEVELATGVKLEDHADRNASVAEIVEICVNPPEQVDSVKSVSYPIKHKASDYLIMRFILGLVKFLYKVRVHGDKNIPTDSAYIICANHVSNIDYMYLISNFDRASYENLVTMAKSELFAGNALSRMVCRIGGMVPIDRGGVVAQSMRALHGQLKDNGCILAFPEGTRSYDGKLGRFKHGSAALAVSANLPIVPAYIDGGYDVYPRQQKLPNFFDFKNGKRYEVNVIYGEPLYPEGNTPEELTERLREAVEELAKNK